MARRVLFALMLVMPVASEVVNWGGWPWPSCWPCDDQPKDDKKKDQ